MSVTPKNRARFAGFVWLVGGTVLVWRGFPFWRRTLDASAMIGIIVLAAALMVGTAKGIFVLRKSARRMITRIESRPGPRPFWEMYPIYFYPLIAVMIGSGILLRHYWGESHPAIIAGVYLGIGAALLSSAAPFFSAARRFQ